MNADALTSIGKLIVLFSILTYQKFSDKSRLASGLYHCRVYSSVKAERHCPLQRDSLFIYTQLFERSTEEPARLPSLHVQYR